jgi:hypothetical protein
MLYRAIYKHNLLTVLGDTHHSDMVHHFKIRCVLKTSDNMPLSPLMGHLHAQSTDGIRQVLFKCPLFNLEF